MYYYDNILQQIDNAVFVHLNATLLLTHWIQLVPISVRRYLSINSY